MVRKNLSWLDLNPSSANSDLSATYVWKIFLAVSDLLERNQRHQHASRLPHLCHLHLEAVSVAQDRQAPSEVGQVLDAPDQIFLQVRRAAGSHGGADPVGADSFDWCRSGRNRRAQPNRVDLIEPAATLSNSFEVLSPNRLSNGTWRHRYL